MHQRLRVTNPPPQSVLSPRVGGWVKQNFSSYLARNLEHGERGKHVENHVQTTQD